MNAISFPSLFPQKLSVWAFYCVMQQTSFQLSELNGSSDLPASKLIKYTNIRLVQLSALDLVE